MNDYQIRIYNSTFSYRSKIISNIIIKKFVEQLYFINLCEKQDIISYKPWIGMINSLNCNTTYLEHYLAMNMNLLITTPDIRVENMPTCIINNNKPLQLQGDIVYTAKINNNEQYLKVINIYLLIICVFVFIVHLYYRIKVIIEQKKLNKKINTIKFTEDCNYKNCTICLEDFKLKSKLSILSCEHIYHKKCINDWIESKNDTMNVKCPNCNTFIYNNNEELTEPLI